ncbi:hypothetical protein DFS34DRAFT_321463 [Phlyctochytrium arcticum]|nr:hypothetical protein DFS34DRAFT_321463 [Phlyctochytrium arcticum]
MKTASPSQPSDTLTDTVDVHLRRLKNGFFGVLFIVNKDEDGGHWIWSALESLIDHFQDLSIPLGFRPFRWQHEVEWLNFTFDIFSPEKFVSTSEGLYIALISILALVLINTLWVGYSFSTNRFRFIWTLKFLRFTLDLFATVLYIPILERFTHTIVRCKHSSLFGEDTEDDELPSVDWHECWTGPYLFKSVITLIVAIIFICLVHAVGATFFKFDPHTKDVEARPHSRIETLYIAIRTVLIILSIVMATYGVPHSMLNRGIFAGVCIVGTGILAFSYIWYIPYYHYKFSVFRSSLQMNFFWMSLCGTYNLFRPRSDIGIIFILLMPVAILLGCLLTQIRRRAIERLDPEKAGALQVELHVRFKLEAAGLLFKDPPKSNITMAAASPGDLSSAAETSRGPTNRVLTESEILDEITEIYNLALRANPHSSLLHLFAGQFYLLRLGNRAQCMASLAKAENLEPKIDEMCMIFRRQRLLNERFSGGDVIDFIAYEQNMLLAKKYARRAEAAVVQFWAELLHRQPSFRRLHHHGAALTTAISNAQQHYTQILKLSPNSPYAYRLYAGFLINVLNDNKQGEQLIEMADELEGDARKGGSQQFNEFNEDEPENNINVGAWADNALVTISGELDNLGHVLNVNQVWLKLFGYKKHEILHQNIDKIVPSPFGEMHDLLLKRYLDTGRAKVIDRPRQVLGVTGHGTLISVTLCVKQITSPEGRISFLGLMNRARTRPGEEFMILDNSFGVLHGTENLTNIFGYSSRGMPVGQWIKGLDYEMVVKAGRSGYRTDVETAHKRYQLLITGDKVEVAAAACYICRVHMSEGVPVHEVGVPPGLQAPLAASGPHYSEGS